MNATTLFEVGKYFQSNGRDDIFYDMIKECINIDKTFAPSFIEVSNINRGKGNFVSEKVALIGFLNCPVNAFTLDLIPQVKARVQEIDRILSGQQPIQPQQPQVVK